MRNGLLAALTVLIAGHGLAFAQPYPDPDSPESITETAERPSTVWALGEYLLWWFKNGRVPPLVTEGGNGVPGSPGTQILVDNLGFDGDVREGGRFTLGYQFNANPCVGVEANYFFLPERQSDESFSSSGDPVLGRPYINAATGALAATLISAPGLASGTVAVGTQTSLTGAEANLTSRLTGSDTFCLTALGGFRYLRLKDELNVSEHFRFAGSTVDLQDDFHTVNRFYGGQVGLEFGARFGVLTIDVRGKLGLGLMHQAADVNGVTNVLNPNGSPTILQGGLLALRTNNGHYERDELAFIPEVDLNVGWEVAHHLKVYAGYSFLWITTVARAGEQIDPVVNESIFPILHNGPLVGPARPAFNFHGTDFWAQGLNFGLELTY